MPILVFKPSCKFGFSRRILILMYCDICQKNLAKLKKMQMKPNNLLINMVKNYNSYVECWKKSLAASNFTFSLRPRHREHDGVFKSNFDAQNPCSWQKKKEKYSRLHLLLTGLHLWSEIFVRRAIHKRRRNIFGEVSNFDVAKYQKVGVR